MPSCQPADNAWVFCRYWVWLMAATAAAMRRTMYFKIGLDLIPGAHLFAEVILARC